ncbi:hypothetical protein K490DRAFT_61830 [Neofusicoccum parvum]|nr:hypothetical protein K490DRAFT_61830 [Neofusicoccum parvum]
MYQHTASAYGADGSWHYISPYHGRSIPLIVFKAFNRSYLMATFFFLSGYFSALTGRKRSRAAFLKDKTIRLGIPTIVSTFLSGPLQLALLRLIQTRQLPDWDTMTAYWASVRGVRGPVWYSALLLVFDTAYILLRPRPSPRAASPPPPAHPTRTRALAAVTSLALLSFGVRLAFPIGRNFVPLSVRPGFVPQYLAAYALGLRLAGRDPRDGVPAPRALLPGLLAACAAAVALGAASASNLPPLVAARGGWNAPALAYALWHEAAGLLVFSALLHGFASVEALRADWGRVGRYSYAAFLVHAPVLVALMGWLDGWRAGGVVKTFVVGSLGVVGSWVAGWVTAQVPGWRRCVV